MWRMTVVPRCVSDAMVIVQTVTKQEFDEYVQARNKALGNVTITCNATFNDGAQKSVNIKVKHQKLTGTQTNSSKFEKDKKYIFVTFEVEA